MATVPIPLYDPIARPRKPDAPRGQKDPYEGLVTEAWIKYFTNQGQQVSNAPILLSVDTLTGQSASISPTALSLPSTSAGLYLIWYRARVTRAATVSSSISVTIAWTEAGLSPTFTSAAQTGNTTTSIVQGPVFVVVDSASPITYATTYASVGATTMQYALWIAANRLSI